MTHITTDRSLPRYVLIPKIGTTSLIDFMNNCSTGKVNPNQAKTCTRVKYTYKCHVVHAHIGPSTPNEHIV